MVLMGLTPCPTRAVLASAISGSHAPRSAQVSSTCPARARSARPEHPPTRQAGPRAARRRARSGWRDHLAEQARRSSCTGSGQCRVHLRHAERRADRHPPPRERLCTLVEQQTPSLPQPSPRAFCRTGPRRPGPRSSQRLRHGLRRTPMRWTISIGANPRLIAGRFGRIVRSWCPRLRGDRNATATGVASATATMTLVWPPAAIPLSDPCGDPPRYTTHPSTWSRR